MREQLVQLLLKQVGVRERTGRNDGPQVEAYLRSIGLPKGYPWCSALLVWGCHQLHLVVRANGRASSWFTPASIINPRTTPPQPGDPIGFCFGRRGATVDHVGANLFWGVGPTADTVQGNTSGNKATGEGGGVYRKWVLKSQIAVVANLFKCLK